MARQGGGRQFLGDLVRACREEMPEFIKAQKRLGPKGLQIVGIAVDQQIKSGNSQQKSV
jgi:hypothetical protein